MPAFADVGDNFQPVTLVRRGDAAAPSCWGEFVERAAGDRPMSRLAEILGFPESTLRGQVNRDRSPTLNELLAVFHRWPAPIREQLVDLFLPGGLELAQAGETDFNQDGRKDLDDAFDAALEAGALGEIALRQLRMLCRHPALVRLQPIDELIQTLRAKRRVIDIAIAVLQRERAAQERRGR